MSKGSEKGIRRSIITDANYRGVVAVRRKLNPESCRRLDDVKTALKSEIRCLDERALGVTVIGFCRYDRRHCGKGPATKKVLEKVASSQDELSVSLGSFAVLGSCSRGRLGVVINSPELEEEEEERTITQKFTEIGFPLRPDYNNRGPYLPHLSLAILDEQTIGHYSDPRIISRLNQAIDLPEITLQPANYSASEKSAVVIA